ncbi:endonuclease MutS2 [Gemelliphila asaccharolytica]|uniref:Endonuclease MutS2 n=1 Tax=Gemelliphila asaccharolytica TaxID=502393 RepID=A0ABR5TMV4_9BACL|nr:endonuclease MutS2 [Gemella asaccharolytica]KXB58658.1 MutS2 family protein [Gemella asaccharolytica]
MKTSVIKKINLDLILDDIEKYCFSEMSIKKIKNLQYIKSYEELLKIHKENLETYYFIKNNGNEINFKIYDYYDILKKSKIKSILSEKEIYKILNNLKIYKNFKNFFKKTTLDENDFPILSGYLDNVEDHTKLLNFLNKILDEDGYIRNDASHELKTLNINILKFEKSLENTVATIVKKFQNKLSENIITKRNDHYVILVKSEFKNDFDGIIHDKSSTGNTFYIEPNEIVNIYNKISILKREKKQEINRILKLVTETISKETNSLEHSLLNFSKIEFSFSKMNFCISKNFNPPIILNNQIIKLKNLYNPLIDESHRVKNDIFLSNNGDSLIITGPNTGGKTVLLKSLAVAIFLAHIGMFIPADANSKIGYYKDIFIDIGDNQSIKNNLSTFSSHIKNIINIVKNSDENSIVLLDELCSGTDPIEGAALSIAILNKFKEKKATIFCTTHYSEIKNYCYESNYYKNASLYFDLTTLKPTYKLIIGLPGQSNAIKISYMLGLEKDIIADAEKNLKNLKNENNLYVEKLSENIKKYSDKIAFLDEQIKSLDEIESTFIHILKDFKKSKEVLNNNLKRKFNEEIESKKIEIKNIYNSMKDNSRTLKQHEINDYIQQIEKLRYDLSDNCNKDITNNNCDKISVGDSVLVIKYNQKALVTKIINDKIQVKLGLLKIVLNRKEVILLNNEEKEDENKKTNNFIFKRNNDNISLDVNVIGKNTEDALIEVEKYIDKVLIAGYDSFTIIHGVGSGILRKNIAKYLEKNKYILNFRSGNENEGGLGVTVVNMK